MCGPNGGVIMGQAGHRSPATGRPDTLAVVIDQIIALGGKRYGADGVKITVEQVAHGGANELEGELQNCLGPISHLRFKIFLGRGHGSPATGRSCACLTTLLFCRGRFK